jgi:hypothetical protein
MNKQDVKDAVKEVLHELGLIVIEPPSGIPVFKWQKHQLNKMKINESCWFKGKKAKELSAMASSVSKKTGFGYTMKTEKEGTRIWRIS